jgi:hypothetical protein
MLTPHVPVPRPVTLRPTSRTATHFQTLVDIPPEREWFAPGVSRLWSCTGSHGTNIGPQADRPSAGSPARD